MTSDPDREGADLRPCPLCGARAVRVFAGHPGYREPMRYDIYGCEACDTRFADPLATDDGIYDLVYRNIEHVRGYARYARYARTVRHRADPLAYLAEEEDSYWAIADFLTTLPTDAGPMLEVGSGLGYLTYAISRRGYDVRGLDISHVAVADARRRFGDLYECGDLRAIAQERPGHYAAVVMTEVIEHVPEVIPLIESALSIVRPGGAVVLTTPNKSASAPHVLWDTDAPPVHLWWFSETSMRTLARRLGATVRFTDFTLFNRTHCNVIDDRPAMAQPSVPPAFDAGGQLLASPNRAKAPLRRAFFSLRLDGIRRAVARRRAALQPASPRRKSLCAIFVRTCG
jgi:2-polyprenyl-3-methyl-5-hydroxy-6-metoxy-1,4-benzoquinol methylase